MARQLWHKWNGESEYFHTLFRIWLELPHDPERPHKRSVKEAYSRHLGHPLGSGTSAPKEVFRAKRNFDWEGRAAAFDEHLQAKVQEGQDRAVIRGAEKATFEKAVNVERMRLEMTNLFDEMSPKLKKAVGEKLDRITSGEEEVSVQGITQLGRFWMDMLRVLDTGEEKADDNAFDPKKLRELLDQEAPKQDPEG